MFDPATLKFSKLSAELGEARDGPGAVLLPSGKVFITSGAPSTGEYMKTAETFDPATSTFSPVKGKPTAPRYQPAVALLPNGKVLIAGGYSGEPTYEYVKTAEIYDPASETFVALTGAH